jgi:hypothetical protein
MRDLRLDLAEVIPLVPEHAEEVLAQVAGVRHLVVEGDYVVADGGVDQGCPGGPPAVQDGPTAGGAARRRGKALEDALLTAA